MKALAYERSHELKDFAIRLMDVPEPALRDADLLVEVRAIGINPGEAFIRRMRSAEAGGRVILGWEFAGVVVRTGPAVEGFEIGDRVFGTGDVSRDGCWAERVAVDHRIVATLPDSFPFDDAASLPVGAITAWEAIFRDRDSLLDGVDRILIVGGAGGVGSLATQLLKATTKAFVICTASRPESQAWCRDMGADLVVDHTQDIAQQLEASGQKHVDMVLSTAGSAENIGRIAQILRPFGTGVDHRRHPCVRRRSARAQIDNPAYRDDLQPDPRRLRPEAPGAHPRNDRGPRGGRIATSDHDDPDPRSER